MRKIAVMNRKGGTAKSTTAANVSAGLALGGNKVLIVDTDSQNHISRMLGVFPEKGLSELLDGEHVEPTEARENLHLISAGTDLTGAVRLIARKSHGSEHSLSDALQGIEGRYDFVILDTPPSVSEITINAMFYCREVLVPVSMEVLALDGFASFLREVEELKRFTDIEIKWVIPTFVDFRARKTTAILDQLNAHFGHLLGPPIHYSSRLSESPAWGKTAYEVDPRHRVAMDYAKLTKEIA